jgi:hypothetical protein
MKKYWFWVFIRLITIPKKASFSGSVFGEVWDNLVIIEASSPKQASEKADKIGKASAGDDDGSLTLNRKKAVCKYLGVVDMGLIHEEIADGCEIFFQISRRNLQKAKLGIKDRRMLLMRVDKELGPIRKAERYN